MEGKSKQILIADDEVDILEIVGYNLSKEGYEIYTAKDGNEALEKAKQLNPDLIILDIMMPKKTGVEVCQILRSQPALEYLPLVKAYALAMQKDWDQSSIAPLVKTMLLETATVLTDNFALKCHRFTSSPQSRCGASTN